MAPYRKHPKALPRFLLYTTHVGPFETTAMTKSIVVDTHNFLKTLPLKKLEITLL